MEINFRAPGLEQLREALKSYAKRGIPHACRNTLNAAAFATREQWQSQIREHMTLRNTWTTRSIRVTKARGTNVRRMEAVVGSLADYMRTQELGGTERKRHKHGVAIPTPRASGEPRGAQPRKRLVRRPNRLPNIQLAARVGTHRRQRNAIAIRQARAAGRKYVFLELEKRRGIFRITGGKRRPKFDLVWDITRPSVRIPPTKTLQRALREVMPTLPRLLKAALLEQLKRANVPGYHEG